MYTIKKVTADTVIDFAAEELKKYLRMMMPRAGEIKIEYAPEATDGFRLGLMSELGLDTSEVSSEYDDLVYIDCDERGGIIAGNNSRSALIAVYRYLKMNGCRWLYPGIDGEYIPICNIKPVKYRKLADNVIRGQCNEGAESQTCMNETIDFSPKIAMNSYMLEFDVPTGYYDHYYKHEGNEINRKPEPITYDNVLQWKRLCEVEMGKRGMHFHDMGHGWTVIPFGLTQFGNGDENLSEENREFMALVDGKRGLTNGRPHLTNVCMSNPKARRRIVDTAVEYASAGRNIASLHITLADGRNKYCECDECRKKNPSDWYVILLNEIDAEFTRLELDTALDYSLYEETTWPAKEKLNNPSRFLQHVCPIWRDYTEPVPEDIKTVALPEFVLNKTQPINTIEGVISAARGWKAVNDVFQYIYDYHFWMHQCLDIGGTQLAKTIHGDIKGFRALGYHGIIEDGSQRSFFPNGFCYYVYGETLFDTSVSFDELKEDYFSHAYGEDWQRVYDFLNEIGKTFDYKYMEGFKSTDKEKGRFYNPPHAEDLRKIKAMVTEFRPFVNSHLNMPYRVQTVSYRLLERFLDFCEGLAYALTLKCVGADAEALAAAAKFFNEFGKREIEIERYYDQSLYAYTYNGYKPIFKGLMDASRDAVNVGIL